jgi:hypothetical protein
MRYFLVAAVVLVAALALTNCARIAGQIDAQDAAKNAKACFAEVWQRRKDSFCLLACGASMS